MYSFTQEQNNAILSYVSLIKKFNKVLNLISPKDMDSLENKHIHDGIQSFRIFMDIYGNPNEYPAYDLGSGNGIPGIIWSILDPASEYNLVEIDVRKSEFLRHCSRELNLTNVNILNQDFKTIDYPDNFIFIARAFMNIDKLLEPSSPLINSTGFLIKGSTWNDELSGINPDYLTEHRYMLNNGQERCLLRYSRNK